MKKLSIRDLQMNNKRVFLRVDFNVPLSDELRVTDDTRIRETLNTIEYAIRQGARLVLASHLGRPKGKPDPRFSLKPVAERLRILLDERIGRGQNVGFATDCVGPQAEEMTQTLERGQVLLLENLRFHPEEEANDEQFSRSLARLADLYVNDAFGAAHRAHASTAGITRFIEKCAAGLLMEKELKYLGRALEDPARPFVAILGGAKVSDKFGVIRHLMTKVDVLLIGGGMAYTFLKAQGREVGRSLVEEDKVPLAAELLKLAAEQPAAGQHAAGQHKEKRRARLLLPVDHVVASEIDPAALISIVEDKQPIPAGKMGLDIGPKTIARFSAEIAQACTIVWNGPMGVFEVEPFARGTMKIARAIADNDQTISIVGGGDSVAALHASGLADKITHISTGGGASLEFLEGKKLPGVEALTDKR